MILTSVTQKPMSELLMRIALNQGLQMSFGVQTPDGKGIAEAGVLATMSNQDALTIMLEDSIALAHR
ncbi:hypothetical protein WDW86_13940 [Bdellovibrionota bacterium FG-2]